MARNGSGTYTLPSGNPVVTGTTISSSWANNTLNDIATALTNSIAKDGQTTPTANLPMGTFKLTGMGVGSANTDSITLGQAQNQGYTLIGGIAGTDTITGSLSPAITAYVAGQKFSFVSAGANTGAVTLNINSLGAKSITKLGTTALVSGDIPSGAVVCVEYDGTQFQLCNLVAQHTVTSDASTNIAAGSAGTIPYQSAASTTAMLATGTAGQVLTSGGAGAPTWGSKVANITGGSAGTIPYQSAADTTAMLAAGTSGYVLTSGGASAPSWAAIRGVAKAWCYFDGTVVGTNAPTAGYNVTSVTRNANGDYTINFTSALASANYAYSGAGRHATGASFVSGTAADTKTTTALRIKTYRTDAAGFADVSEVYVVCFDN